MKSVTEITGVKSTAIDNVFHFDDRSILHGHIHTDPEYWRNEAKKRELIATFFETFDDPVDRAAQSLHRQITGADLDITNEAKRQEWRAHVRLMHFALQDYDLEK